MLRLLWPSSWTGRAVALLTAWGVAGIGLASWPSARAATPPDNRPIPAAVAGFVTSDTCRSCHPGRYADWHASFHRTMTQVATPASVLPKMDGTELTRDGFTYRIERKGDAYQVRRRKAGAPAGASEPPRAIVLLTGSHNMQFLWLAAGKGRTMEHFPFGWLVAEKMWAPLDDTFLAPPEFHPLQADGDWNRGCIDCHTTQGRSRALPGGGFDSEVSEFGISCEACHAEARAHVERERNPVQRYLARLAGRPDPTIANPAKMDGPRSALVCGQCHSVWSFNSAAERAAWNLEGSKFRPGRTDLGGRFVVQPADSAHLEEKKAILADDPYFYKDSFWADGMVRVVGREYNGVVSSPCFKGGAYSCVSCHEMHSEPAPDATLRARAVNQLKPEAMSNRACLQCHEAIGSNLSAHTHHAADSVGSQCYDCHMPYSSFGLLRAVRSHQVSSPTAAESVTFGRPNACNLCHLDKPLAWTAEKLHAWYGTPVPEFLTDDRKIAAGAKWLITGDAGQRALIAWSMGWAPAQKASGRDWFTPYLAATLVDPYAAVRFVAGKSLQTLPGFKGFAFNYIADRPTIKAAAATAIKQWAEMQKRRPQAFDAATLVQPDGSLEEFAYYRLLLERDNSFIFLVE